MRSSRGQASVDYVALIGLVAAVLAIGAGAVGVPWLGPRLAGAIRHGICVVSGSLCTPAQARAEGFEPCVVHRRSEVERAGLTAVVHLERGDTLVVERRSDGTVEVAFADGHEVGAELGLGFQLPVVRATAVAGIGARFTTGRSYAFADWPAAQRFLARFARSEGLGGEGRRALQALCPGCPEWLEGAAAARPPEPSARFLEGGVTTDLLAQLGLDVPGGRLALGAEADGGRLRAFGRRVAGPRTTWYLRLEKSAVAELGLLLGSLSSAGSREGVLEVTQEAGRLVDVRVRAASRVDADVDLGGSARAVAGLVERLRGGVASAGDDPGGMAVEASAGLDLRDPADRRAVEALLSPGLSPLGWLERVRAVGRRLDSAGTAELRVLRTRRRSEGHRAGVGAAVRVGAEYSRDEEVRELIGAWSIRAGAGRRREDCEAAAQPAGRRPRR